MSRRRGREGATEERGMVRRETAKNAEADTVLWVGEDPMTGHG
jgi:hypothetical protein